jgi:hypothetical protein
VAGASFVKWHGSVTGHQRPPDSTFTVRPPSRNRRTFASETELAVPSQPSGPRSLGLRWPIGGLVLFVVLYLGL